MSEFICTKCNRPIPAGQPIVFNRDTGSAEHFLADHCVRQQEVILKEIKQGTRSVKCLCGVSAVCPLHGIE